LSRGGTGEGDLVASGFDVGVIFHIIKEKAETFAGFGLFRFATDHRGQ
jgi:hypothetical protein